MPQGGVDERLRHLNHFPRVRPVSFPAALRPIHFPTLLAIWYFRNCIYLLALEEGESDSVPIDVIWDFVVVMIPLVLAATGRRLWQRGA